MSECVRVATRAMSTDVSMIIVGGDPSLAHWAQHRVEVLEQRWSRFRDDSDISRLNRASGEPVEVSGETVAAVRSACAAWAFTAGCFDPTVHDSLLRLGYDDTIDSVRDRGAAATGAPLPAPGCTGIWFDESTSTVCLPAGVRLDLGGIGKGLAADDVAAGLLARGATGAMVNIGGDVRVIGSPSDSPAWRVEVEDPRTARICAVVELLDGGVATSSTLRRRWLRGHTPVHHLIDPFTGANARSNVSPPVGVTVGVAVVAGSAGWADALSKVPFVEGRNHAASLGPTSALVLRDDGTVEALGPPLFSLVVPA